MEDLALQHDVPAVSDTWRRPLDQYFTPDALASTLIHLLVRDGFYGYSGDSAMEPSAGGGAFVRAMREHRPKRLQAVDIDPARCASLRAICPDVVCADFAAHPWEHFDLIAGNPPYSEAERHVRHALAHRTDSGAVAFLLRLAFLETKARYPFWTEHRASKIYVLSERPSFTGGATDSCAYGWFVWRRGWSGPTELEVVSWR